MQKDHVKDQEHHAGREEAIRDDQIELEEQADVEELCATPYLPSPAEDLQDYPLSGNTSDDWPFDRGAYRDRQQERCAYETWRDAAIRADQE